MATEPPYRMIKVVLAHDRQIVLLFAEDFVEGVHGEEGDPRHAELLDDGVGHGRLATRAPAAYPDEERFNQLALTVVPKIDSENG